MLLDRSSGSLRSIFYPGIILSWRRLVHARRKLHHAHCLCACNTFSKFCVAVIACLQSLASLMSCCWSKCLQHYIPPFVVSRREPARAYVQVSSAVWRSMAICGSCVSRCCQRFVTQVDSGQRTLLSGSTTPEGPTPWRGDLLHCRVQTGTDNAWVTPHGSDGRRCSWRSCRHRVCIGTSLHHQRLPP